MLVGKDEQPFTVHKRSICKKSPYFIAASSEAWQQEGEKDTVRLSGVDVDTFTLYIHWVYSGVVDVEVVETKGICRHDELTCPDNRCKSSFHSSLLTKLYIAGELLLDPALKISTMDALMPHIRNCVHIGQGPFSWNTVDRVWKNTPPECALRRCIVDYFLTYHARGGLTTAVENINPQFLLDLCNQQFNIRGCPPNSCYKVFKTPGCLYHDHGANDECQSRIKAEPED